VDIFLRHCVESESFCLFVQILEIVDSHAVALSRCIAEVELVAW